MKKIKFICIFFCIFFITQAQDKFTSYNKGKVFFYWGGNRDYYTNSDIHFKGNDYNFILKNTVSNDVPKGWHIDYINPTRLTIPQNNFKIGYFFNDRFSLSIGFDHMKYVLTPNQTVSVDGYYPNQGSYDELLSDNKIKITKKFLSFEHTDGLNYIHPELAVHQDISNFLSIKDTDIIQVNVVGGVGMGVLFPRTDATLLGKKRSDNFHVAGFGVSVKTALNLTFFKYFFVQTELKGGYINMPDIKTTNSNDDSASQSFYFLQKIFVVGSIFKI